MKGCGVLRNETFPSVSINDWAIAAEASLKGRSLSAVTTKTAEGIELKPLYTQEDRPAEGALPGQAPFTRGFHSIQAFPKTGPALEQDFISSGAAAGVFPSDAAIQNLHNNQQIAINTVPYHMGGAHAVQELALALSEAAHHLKIAKDKKQAASAFLFHFAAGSVFFTEIAKLRAYKTLWHAFTQAFELDESIKPLISVETSETAMSLLDPHVNILRAGSAAFAAVIGSADYVTVKPFDDITDEPAAHSKRLAAAIPHLLQYEALLDKVIDPAGGSYYIEALTNEIGRLAWDLFADIEEAGGIGEALKSGTIQRDIQAVYEERRQQIATGQLHMIGTNMYANPTEQLKPARHKKDFSKVEGTAIQPIKPKRMAEPFERLRLHSMRIKQTGQSVEVGLICLGDVNEHKPRADYVEGIMSVAGIASNRSGICKSAEEAKAFVDQTKLPYYCICGTDEWYDKLAEKVASEVKKSSAAVKVEIAGKWNKAVIDGQVAAGVDIVQKLEGILSLFKGGDQRDAKRNESI